MVSVRMESAAVSVSRLPVLAGWDNVASSPSGVPVLKRNGSARAGAASHAPTVTVAPINRYFIRTFSSFFGSGQSDRAGCMVDRRLRFRSKQAKIRRTAGIDDGTAVRLRLESSFDRLRDDENRSTPLVR